MPRSALFTTTLLLLISASIASAADIVSVRLVESPSIVFSTTQPARAPTTVPSDAKTALLLETRIAEDGSFLAECVVDGKTVHVAGKVIAGHDGKDVTQLAFSVREANDSTNVNTDVTVQPGKQMIIAGVSTGTAQLVVLEIRHGG
jgi:hypothetical protein